MSFSVTSKHASQWQAQYSWGELSGDLMASDLELELMELMSV